VRAFNGRTIDIQDHFAVFSVFQVILFLNCFFVMQEWPEQAKLLQKNISHVIFGSETFTRENSQGSDIRSGASKMLIPVRFHTLPCDMRTRPFIK